MEIEYKDPSRKGRWIVLLGVVLAIVAGAAAFGLINRAQQQAGTTGIKTIQGLVAARPILAGQAVKSEDLLLRNDIPLDGTNAEAVITDPALLVDHLLAVDVPQGQLLTRNLLASTTAGLGFTILSPTESVAPDSEAWRAISVNVPDDRAVGGVLGPGMVVDIFVSALVTVPQPQAAEAAEAGESAAPVAVDNPFGDLYSDRSTKVTYQGVGILSRLNSLYILKVPLAVAEEITHLQSDGSAQFSIALRPDQDGRILDATGLGATTSRIIERYGLPIPEHYPALGRPVPSNPPIPALTPPPSAAP